MANSNNAILAMNPYGPNVMDSFFNSLTNMSNIANTRARTKQSNLLNAFTEATQPDAIGWENTKNQLNTQYYPQEKRVGLDQLLAGLGLTNAQASHQNALTQQARAQTGLMTQKDNPFATFQAAVQQYKASPDNSLAKQYYGAVLSSLMGQATGAQPVGQPSLTSGKTKTGSAISGIPQGTSFNGITLNPMGATGKAGSFRQGIMGNDEEGFTTLESPTAASATSSQNRIAAESEISKLVPTVHEGLSPYAGALGGASLMSDIALYQSLPKNTKQAKELKKKLENFALAKRYLSELASINARQATGQNPGIELTREYKESMFPDVPSDAFSHWIPRDIQNASRERYFPLQREAIQQAINQERTGFQQNMSQAPGWAPPQVEMQSQYFPDVGNFAIPIAKPRVPVQNATNNPGISNDLISAAQAELQRRLQGGK